MTDAMPRRAHLAPTALSQYIGLDNCDRYLRFYLHKGETAALAQHLAGQTALAGTPWQAFQPLSPLLAEIGESVERDVIASLEAQGHNVQDLIALKPPDVLEIFRQLDNQPGYLYQIPMRGLLGRWVFEGRADLLKLERNAQDGSINALVIDIKASRKDKVQHRLQVAVYVRMLEQMLREAGEVPGQFQGAIVRRSPDGQLQDPAQAVPFELEPYLDTIRFLTEGPDSPLEKVDAAPDFTRLHYYLGPKCDGCNFSPVCLAESSERQDLSLIPFLESSDKRVLNQAGIFTLSDLTSLKQIVRPEEVTPAPKLDYPTVPLDAANAAEKKLTADEGAQVKRARPRLKTTPGKEAIIEELSQRWPLAPRLDRLIQRAARARRHFDKTTPALPYFLDRTPRRSRSNLPDEQLYPDMLKIFLDVQLDYLEDRIYLVGALITGKDGQERVIVRMTENTPGPESERALLLDWVARILAAVTELAGTAEAVPLHLYLYNRRDQRVLLDALRRHLAAFAALPALYQLLTDTPALTQPALAFLYDEVRERLNLLGPLASLQAVSRQLGFSWTDSAGNNFLRLFRSGVFDYGLRRNDGVYVQTTARFYSGLPLEYAYAAWNRLEKATRSFKGITRPQIEAFQAHRLRALAHIEKSFPYKNRFLQKEPVRLAGLLEPVAENSSLARVLEEFLHIEQYSSLQQHLEWFSRPILKRVEQGRALLVRCTDLESIELSRRRKSLHASFLAEFDKVNINPQTALQVSKLKEGDFVTLSLLENDGQPWKIVGGRLARIEEITGEWLKLELSGSTLGQGQSSVFRYYHDRELLPKPGQYYMIDPMVDNLNGDKLQEACRHAEQNRLYQIQEPSIKYQVSSIKEKSEVGSIKSELSIKYQVSSNNSEATPNSQLPTPNSAFPDNRQPTTDNPFITLIQQLEGVERAPTKDQLEVIGGHLDEPLFLVQGPPGTGKSHTIGWAVLNRIVQGSGLLLQGETDKAAGILGITAETGIKSESSSKLTIQNGQFKIQNSKPSNRRPKSKPNAEISPDNSFTTNDPAFPKAQPVTYVPPPTTHNRQPTTRIIVSSQTHNAVEIVLESIAEKWRRVQAAGGEWAELLKDLKIYKAGGDEQGRRSPEVGYIDPWDKVQVKAALDDEHKMLVIGATPGNLYNLMKEFYGRGKKKQDLVWEEKFFDWLVLDEASQMNLPHALLAAGWLKPEGQVLIVGDHRQLAPILAYGWEQEEHLPHAGAKPYRSVFQYFLDAGFGRVALNESFRLHSTQAAFLQANIYRQDGIQFHSRQQKRLPDLRLTLDDGELNLSKQSSTFANSHASQPSIPLTRNSQPATRNLLTDHRPPTTDHPASSIVNFVRATLDPDYPIVVIEHNEAGSQQYNPVEVELLTPLIMAATKELGLDGVNGIGVVVPHSAQKAILRDRFPALAKVNAIDTVERFQGGERDLIIVSTTASDPDYVAAEAEFLLSPNRFNVALSRPRCKLIVITSRSVLQFVSARLELFEQAQLWKRLAAVCGEQPLWTGRPIKPPANLDLQVNVFGHKGV